MRSVLTVAVTVAAVVSAPALVAQQSDEERQQRDTQALLGAVEAVAAGTEPTPTGISLQWEGNHFMKGAEGMTYIPFSLAVDASQLTQGATLYVRAVSKDVVPVPDAETAESPETVEYPWDDINFLDVVQEDRISRAMALAPGEYEVFVAIKQRAPAEVEDDQLPLIAGLLRRDITVPDFEANLSMSSVLIGEIAPLAAPLSEDEQAENPYTFGQMDVTVAAESRLSKAGELQMLFWIYGTGQNDNKPDVTIEYSFHRQIADGGEVYFNKTPPQTLNASTLPPQFDVTTDQLPGMLFVPLGSFPEGTYRLEIKLTDTISGETLTTNANFTVEA